MYKFYVKKVGGGVPLYDGATHTFIADAKDFKEASEKVKEFRKMSEEEYWSMLLYKRHARVPNRAVSGTVDKIQADNQKAYEGMWSGGTEEFYKKFPKLKEEAVVPYELINRIRREKHNEEQAKYDKRMAEAKELAELDELAKKQEKIEAKKVKPEPKPEKKKKLGKKLFKKRVKKIIKKVGNRQAILVEDENPFA
jgi:hypothetical protein